MTITFSEVVQIGHCKIPRTPGRTKNKKIWNIFEKNPRTLMYKRQLILRQLAHAVKKPASR